nr:FtsQ-type POTRA domain-containing protein [Aliikangiella sp. G2MR2-5]
MAIKKQQRKFSFEFPRASKAVFRSTGLLAFFALIFATFYYSSRWYQTAWPIDKVAFQHQPVYLDKKDILKLIDNQSPRGMWAIDIEELQDLVVELPWVRSVEIRKIWPDQLSLNIIEHQPVARFDSLVLTQSNTLINVNENIQKFKGLPEIKVAEREELSTAIYADIWQEYKQLRLNFELIELELYTLHVDTINNWKLTFTNGLEINLGRKDHLSRVERLVNVYSSVKPKNKLARIDLRYNNGFAVEWKKEAEQEG